MLPATVALSGDYLPERLRAGGIMIVFTGAPLGGFLGGMLVVAIVADLRMDVDLLARWPAAAGADPGGVALAPEIARFLLARGRLTEGSQHVMRQLGINLDVPSHSVDVAQGNPVAGLFRDGLGTTTILIWIMFFSNLLSMYLIGYWLPTMRCLSG